MVSDRLCDDWPKRPKTPPPQKPLLYRTFTREKAPIVSVVVPVYNQVQGISAVLKSIAENLVVPFELIVIDDGSKDDTVSAVKSVCSGDTFTVSSATDIFVYRFRKSKFEVYCDWFGFEYARGKYFLEIQADMILCEKGFDVRMIEVLDIFPDIVAISGRGTERLSNIHADYKRKGGTDISLSARKSAHLVMALLRYLRNVVRKILANSVRRIQQTEKIGLSNEVDRNRSCKVPSNWFPDKKLFSNIGRAGRLGADIFDELNDGFPKNTIWIGESVMRGPLLINAEMYREVGGLDVSGFFQGFDDHDFSLRAWFKKNYRVAFLPVNFVSPRSSGTTRQRRSFFQEISIFYRYFLLGKKWKKSALYRCDEILHVKPMIEEIRSFDSQHP